MGGHGRLRDIWCTKATSRAAHAHATNHMRAHPVGYRARRRRGRRLGRALESGIDVHRLDPLLDAAGGPVDGLTKRVGRPRGQVRGDERLQGSLLSGWMNFVAGAHFPTVPESASVTNPNHSSHTTLPLTALPPVVSASTSSGVNLESEMPLTRWPNSRLQITAEQGGERTDIERAAVGTTRDATAPNPDPLLTGHRCRPCTQRR